MALMHVPQRGNELTAECSRPGLLPLHDRQARTAAVALGSVKAECGMTLVPKWFQRTRTEHGALPGASLAFLGFAWVCVGLPRVTSAPAEITNQLLCL